MDPVDKLLLINDFMAVCRQRQANLERFTSRCTEELWQSIKAADIKIFGDRFQRVGDFVPAHGAEGLNELSRWSHREIRALDSHIDEDYHHCEKTVMGMIAHADKPTMRRFEDLALEHAAGMRQLDQFVYREILLIKRAHARELGTYKD